VFWIDEADAELLALGIKNPARLTAVRLPGFEGLRGFSVLNET
jgi:hypothetical protein